jgi:hypothetical protein
MGLRVEGRYAMFVSTFSPSFWEEVKKDKSNITCERDVPYIMILSGYQDPSSEIDFRNF